MRAPAQADHLTDAVPLPTLAALVPTPVAERELAKLGVTRTHLWRNNTGHQVLDFEVGGHKRRYVLSGSSDPNARYAIKSKLRHVALGVAS